MRAPAPWTFAEATPLSIGKPGIEPAPAAAGSRNPVRNEPAAAVPACAANAPTTSAQASQRPCVFNVRTPRSVPMSLSLSE